MGSGKKWLTPHFDPTLPSFRELLGRKICNLRKWSTPKNLTVSQTNLTKELNELMKSNFKVLAFKKIEIFG